MCKPCQNPPNFRQMPNDTVLCMHACHGYIVHFYNLWKNQPYGEKPASFYKLYKND